MHALIIRLIVAREYFLNTITYCLLIHPAHPPQISNNMVFLSTLLPNMFRFWVAYKVKGQRLTMYNYM